MAFTVETEYQSIDFTSKKAYKKVMEVCSKNGINLDYYFLEFDTTDTEPENYDWDLMSDAWDSAAEEE